MNCGIYIGKPRAVLNGLDEFAIKVETQQRRHESEKVIKAVHKTNIIHVSVRVQMAQVTSKGVENISHATCLRLIA